MQGQLAGGGEVAEDLIAVEVDGDGVLAGEPVVGDSARGDQDERPDPYRDIARRAHHEALRSRTAGRGHEVLPRPLDRVLPYLVGHAAILSGGAGCHRDGRVTEITQIVLKAVFQRRCRHPDKQSDKSSLQNTTTPP